MISFLFQTQVNTSQHPFEKRLKVAVMAKKQPRLLRLCRPLAICLLTIPIEASALTFKSDGSVVQKSGAVVRADDASRYQAALEAFNRGEPGRRFTPFVTFEVQATK